MHAPRYTRRRQTTRHIIDIVVPSTCKPETMYEFVENDKEKIMLTFVYWTIILMEKQQMRMGR